MNLRNINNDSLKDWFNQRSNEIAQNFDKRIITTEDLLILILKEQDEQIRYLELKLDQMTKPSEQLTKKNFL